MSKLQLCLIPSLAGAVFLLTGAVEPTAAPLLSIPNPEQATSLTPWQGEPHPLPAALQNIKPADLLAHAATPLRPQQVAWLDMSFRQEVAYDDITYAMEGRYLTAPGDRFRYDLKVKI